MSDDIILDLITDTVPREEQLSLFTGAERYGISGVEVEEMHASKSGRKKKAKKLDPHDFGRGKIERRRSMLSRVDDVPFDELTVQAYMANNPVLQDGGPAPLAFVLPPVSTMADL